MSFFFNDTTTTEIYTLSLHDALPIYQHRHTTDQVVPEITDVQGPKKDQHQALSKKRSEEHTSELQSPYDLVCRLLLEKKKDTTGHSRSAELITPMKLLVRCQREQ